MTNKIQAMWCILKGHTWGRVHQQVRVCTRCGEWEVPW